MDAGDFEIYLEVDGIPLLNYPDAEGAKAYVCSVENKVYMPWYVNHTTEVLSVKFSVDSKPQPSFKTAYPSQPRRLRTAVSADDGGEVYAEFRFGSNPPPSAHVDAVIPSENLDQVGRIDVTVYGSIFVGPRRVISHQPRPLSEVKPQAVELPEAKRKVGACTTSVSCGNVKVSRYGVSSGYAVNTNELLATFTLYYRPARILCYYGLQGIQPKDVDWAGWLRTKQFPRVPSLHVPPNALIAPRVRTPVAWISPQVQTGQAVIRTAHWASKAALELDAAQNGLSLECQVETLEEALALAVWGDATASEAIGHCIRCQRQGQMRHYNALVAHGWAEDAVQLKAFSDFFQVPIALHAPGSEPAVQVLISPLMQKPERCYALGLLKDEWVVLQPKGEEEPKPVVVIEID